jgi:Glycosyl hydrolases family 2/Glycosyl hydrolases family 2, sugar binding domain
VLGTAEDKEWSDSRMNKLVTIVGMVLFVGVFVHSAESVSLAGDWRFEIAGADANAFTRELPGRIQLPGTMDDAGLGPRNTKPSKLTGAPKELNFNDKPPKWNFRDAMPENVAVFEGPYRLYDYAGPAWYQRTIDIPEAWQGKRVTLFLERCRWVTSVWLNDKHIGSQDSLVIPHIYDLGIGLKPGKHRLTICVDNSDKINLGKFVSALRGGTWGNMNGIVGRIELEARPILWCETPRIFPSNDGTVRVEVVLGNYFGRPVSGRIKMEITEKKSGQQVGRSEQAFAIPTGIGTDGKDIFYPYYPIEQTVKLEQPPKLWSEFTPDMYELSTTVTVDGQNIKDTVVTSFGFREFGVKGTQFTLNGRPVYLRGTLECSIWPLTGYPPTDIKSWQRIYRIMKSYGLNHIRFHSWCPPEAAFAAADVEGIIVQAEAPRANVQVGQDPARDAFTEAELKRIVDTYGNHPSFCLMTPGNEYGGKDEVLTRWVDMLIKLDPRHLYSSASCAQKTTNRQFTVHADGRGIKSQGTMRDLRDVVAKDPRPLLGHEIGQWMYWPDSREIKKWKGVMALKNYEVVRDSLKAKGLFDQERQFVESCGRFATLLYKEEIEVLLRTPGYAGFALLDLHDYPTQGTAVIGPLDAFWDSKGFITPEEYRRFCSATVPLLRMPKRTYSQQEPFEATVDLAHYGPTDLVDIKPVWTIKDQKGREVASGSLPVIKATTGALNPLGEIKASLAGASVPCKLKVTVSLEGTDTANDWDIWVYPELTEIQKPAGVTVAETWEEASKALSEGGKVLFFPAWSCPKQTISGSFLPVFWSPVWFPSQKPNTMGLLCDPKHPLFKQFPTDCSIDWQWYNLMNNSKLVNLDFSPAKFKPVVQVIDNFQRNKKLGIVFEGRVGKGQLLVCGFDLKKVDNDPAARQLLSSLYAYVASPAFKPSTELKSETLEALFAPAPAKESEAKK